MKFKADRIEFFPTDGDYLASAYFATTPIGRRAEQKYLSICRDVNPDERGNVEVEINDQSFSTGGRLPQGVQRCELTKDAIRLLVTDEAAERLGLGDGEEVVVRFNLPKDQLLLLNETLKVIFSEGTAYAFIDL